MPLIPGRKRPQPSQAANNGNCVKEEHEPHKGPLCSCRAATRSIVVVNRWFSPPQPKKVLSIRLLLWTKRPRLLPLPSTIARQLLESSVSLRTLYLRKKTEGKGTARRAPKLA
ncbi:hypothetical protein TcCL_ESM00843 [Trypanosoma cruzi]|nr:hypothetical protein TcCL_ESM00843 [Trypanosoma cruzi]